MIIKLSFHTVVYEAAERIPQTLLGPAPMLMYPDIPHVAPHEFMRMK